MQKLKVLIAEDDKVTQKLYEQALPDNMFERKIASDGDEALAIYSSEWKPDIILLDIMKPHKNVYQTLKRIRQTHEDTSTTVIMVTSVSEKGDIMACAKLGIQGFIVKPIVTSELGPTVVKYHKAAPKK